MGDVSMSALQGDGRRKVWATKVKQGRGGATGAALAALALSLSAGCTALLETSEKQCAIDGDCADRFGQGSIYVCTNEMCEQPLCEVDAECRARGGDAFATAICREGRCAPAECFDNGGCSVGQACDKLTNHCVRRECDTAAECVPASPTASCDEGICRDDTWSCIGQPDNRPRVPGELATLRVPLLSSLSNQPVPGAQFQIKVCSPPQFDPDCATPLSVTPEYDPATGIATVSGLAYDVPIRLQIDEVSMKEADGSPSIVAMDFYSQKPAVGVMDVPPLRVVSRQGLNALINSFGDIGGMGGNPIDPTLGSLYSLVFDCQDRPAGQVRLQFTNALEEEFAPSLVLYFDEMGVPSLTRKWSYPTGVFSTLNLPIENINITTRLVVNEQTSPVGDTIIRPDYKMQPVQGRMTTVHFYPRAY